MATHKIWLLRLVLPGKNGRLLSALIIFTALFGLFLWSVEAEPDLRTPMLFFSAIVAYSVAVFSFITEKCRDALMELKPGLNMEEQSFAQTQALLGTGTTTQLIWLTIAGLAAGFCHVNLLNGSLNSLIYSSANGSPVVTSLSGYLGTLMVWLVIATLVYFLIEYASLFARLGRESVEVDLLNSRLLVPYSRVAIISSLSKIGGLALFPLMYLDESMNVQSVLPGMLGMGIPMLVMLAIPIWPVHKRLVAAKESALTNLNQRIETCRDGTPASALNNEQLEAINPLLQYRREILQAPVWPIDASSVTRLGLYLVIVPLTWAGAALIEILMESYL
jgi:hypothetical protein